MEKDFSIYNGILERYVGSSDEVEIPNGVIKIERFAFANCTIHNLLIPQSVTDIEFNAFIGCGCLEHIAVEEGNPRYDSRNGCNAIIESATNILLKGCKNTLIPQGISDIAAWAFDGCEELVEVIIPHSVKKIGEFAFADCNGLKEIIIPESVDFVNYCTFSGCEELTKLVLPSSLTFIGANAFGGCDNLTIHCHAGSYAEQYAKEQGIKYQLMEG